MLSRDELVASIYEAGALPDRWPALMDLLAAATGGRGGNLMRANEDGIRMMCSQGTEALSREFERQGWHERNNRIDRLLERASHPGFLTDRDVHTAEEIATLPIYRDFLTPNHADSGAATVIQGGRDDCMILAIEAFEDAQAAWDAVPLLDSLRPHLARAMVLSSQMKLERMRAAVHALETIGVPAALLDGRGKVRAANPLFEVQLETVLLEGATRLRVVDAQADTALADALDRLRATSEGRSIALRDPAGFGHAALHLVPVRGEARDLFTDALCFALIASGENRALPGADLLQALFDLTPAEARVARAISSGGNPHAIAKEAGTSPETVRSQLKQVFLKTSTSRQNELTALLHRYSRP
jgi:DNA-binding CsgD family transcriptional regulator